MKNFTRKKENNKKNILFKTISILFFAVFLLPVFSKAQIGVESNTQTFDKKENAQSIERERQETWRVQKANIILNIKKEISLNNFLISQELNQKINNLHFIENQDNFIFSVKDIYLELDKYYTNGKSYQNTDFSLLRNLILEKIDNFFTIENLKVSQKFKKDLAVLKTVKSQKLFLKRLEMFFNEHIKNFSLRSGIRKN